MLLPRVLIIDDNQTHQRLATLLCAKNGINSAVASCVDEAINELEQHPIYTAVLIDLGIPKSPQALLCIRRLLALRRTRHLPFRIVAVTAHAMESDRRDCLLLGADNYLSKPYTTQQFAEMLKRSHEQRRVKRQAS